MLAYLLACKTLSTPHIEVPRLPTLPPMMGGNKVLYTHDIAPSGIYGYVTRQAKYPVRDPPDRPTVTLSPMCPDKAGTPGKVGRTEKHWPTAPAG